MIEADTVTFGGSSLDRAAELRSDPAAINALMVQPGACGVVLWRGKPLVEQVAEDRMVLVRLPLDHQIFSGISTSPIFMGLEGERGIFAFDLGNWEPESLDHEALNAFADQSEQHHPSVDQTMVFAEIRAIMTRLSPRDAELVATARAVQNWHESHGFCARCGAPSEVSQAGWQRDCGVCGTHHFPRTDPVVIMAITHGNSILMGRSPGLPVGMYSLLAGFIEPGETVEAAVRREVFEEAGVRVGRVGYVASQPWPFPASLMIGCVGQAQSTEISIDPKEIEDASWITREDMMEVFAGRHPKIRPPRKGAIAEFILRNWLADRLV